MQAAMNGSNAGASHDGITSPSLSPSRVQNLLKAGMTGATARLRHWEPPSVAELQRLLPQYEITAFLARGGMGAVYQAIQPSLGRVVAIKILPPDVVDDHVDYAVRFKREARAMAALTHPNIVLVYEAGETPEGLLFFAMEHFSFAWGTQWPPPRLAGNLGDESLRRGTGQEPVIDGYDDGYVTTAPVMSLQPNPIGIYDLSGNVWQVCPDEFDSRTRDVVGRGSSFNNGNPDPRAAYVAINIRNPRSPHHRSENSGFCIVADKRTP